MLTMCGCPDSLPIAICSRTNRSRLSGSRSAVSTFTATVRSRARWRQRYTTPNPPRPISSGRSKPAATSSAGIPACTSPCVGRGSLSAIARLALQRRHGGTMATRPELNPNSGAAMAMNDDVAGVPREFAIVPAAPRVTVDMPISWACNKVMQDLDDVVEDVTVLGQARCPERPEIRLADPRLNQRVWVDE